eukprot:SAG11_NODE_735_length_7452_cov_26.426629_13_plen_166_part_00
MASATGPPTTSGTSGDDASADDRASTLPAPLHSGLVSDDEDDPLADTEGDTSALQAPAGVAGAKYDAAWFKEPGDQYFADVGGGQRKVDWSRYMADFSPRMPAATKLDWQQEDPDFKNQAWAEKREWRGPKPGLNLEYWGKLRTVLADDDLLHTYMHSGPSIGMN